jgi:thiazole synthase ThiGH ThiG subunit
LGESKERALFDEHYKVPCCKTIKGAGFSGLFSSVETMARKDILECMSSEAELDVPLVVDAGVG